MGFWGFGVLGFWGFGVLGFWGFGVLGTMYGGNKTVNVGGITQDKTHPQSINKCSLAHTLSTSTFSQIQQGGGGSRGFLHSANAHLRNMDDEEGKSISTGIGKGYLSNVPSTGKGLGIPMKTPNLSIQLPTNNIPPTTYTSLTTRNSALQPSTGLGGIGGGVTSRGPLKPKPNIIQLQVFIYLFIYIAWQKNSYS